MHTSSAAASRAAHARAAALSLVLCLFFNTPTTCGFQTTTMMVARASWKEYWLAKNGAKNAPAAVPSTRGAARRSSRTRWEPTRPAWWIAKSPAKVQGSPPVLETPVLDGGSFDKEQITDVLQHEYRHNLVRVAQKYDSLIESVEGVDAITIKELDGDHMQLDVVYCDQGERTCVAVAVPVIFPYHCNDADCVIGVIHELEQAENVEPRPAMANVPPKYVSPELIGTIARICAVMNRDFQDELRNFVRAFGGPVADEMVGNCEMLSLSPDGFMVRSDANPDKPVSIAFSKECQSALDFQKQILLVSERAMAIA
ncbi:unnamed protein product [Ectocarpus sp. CCAP 1310/34]|nr:unnamed protein product [Ectocarpus sp. CCAP 1310/34]